MTYIEDIIANIEPPKSIWKISVSKNWHDEIIVNFTSDREMQCPDENNLTKMIYTNVRSRWDSDDGKFKIDESNSYYHVRLHMKRSLIDLYEEQCKALHPSKTKLGKWLEQSDFLMNKNTEKVVMELWKYVVSNRSDNNHMENAFKIFKSLMAKYEEQYETGSYRRRW